MTEITNLILEEDYSPARITVPRGIVLTVAGYGWFPAKECAFGEVIEDVMPDVVRLMKSVASSCTDASNVSLHFDELIGELHLKLAQILNNRTIIWESRTQFFGFLKVSFQRHLKSTVQKYALTYKRTGIKPKKPGEISEETAAYPTRKEDSHEAEHGGQIAMDDSETGAQFWLGENDEGFDNLELSDEITHFVEERLSDEEKRVFFQEVEPNDKAMRLALGTIPMGRQSRKFRILDRHKADGIDMPIYAYKRNLERIREKLLESWKFGCKSQYEQLASHVS